MNPVIPSKSYGIWVGFNDLNPFIASSSTVLSTGSPHWTKPPRLGETADILAFDLNRQQGEVVGKTLAVNYPIGSRIQAVLSNRRPFYLINNISNGTACLDIYDDRFSLSNRIFGLHHWCTTKNMTFSYCADFQKSHRLGGYGYIFGRHGHSNSPYKFPDSLSRYNHLTANHEEILSLSEVTSSVANYLNVDKKDLSHSYLTHLLLSPDEKSLAFLFRTWLRDGGLLSALCNLDLSEPVRSDHFSIELVGQLSHFTWVSTDQLMIYAYQILNRNSARIILNSFSRFFPLSKLAKSLRKLLNRYSTPPLNELSYTYDLSPPELILGRNQLPAFVLPVRGICNSPFFPLPIYDGHPSCSFSDSQSYLISDTYPDRLGNRCLFSINITSGTLHSISIVHEHRDSLVPVYPWVGNEIQLPRYASFSEVDQSYTRSGLHCDCHPFYNEDQTMFAYHTSEDGYRTVKLKKLIQE